MNGVQRENIVLKMQLAVVKINRQKSLRGNVICMILYRKLGNILK